MATGRPCCLNETQLGKWMRAVKRQDREDLARYAGCDVYYLRVLAGVHRENPKLRLAMAIVRGVEIVNERHKAQNPGDPYPPLTLADLASPTRKGDDDESLLGMEFLCKD